MAKPQNNYRNVCLVRPDAPDYVAFMRRMADQRPSRGGPRAAGEYLGGLVERCIQHWLSRFVLLDQERILAWEQQLRNGRYGTLYRELDGVWTIDAESLCLFEIKLTFPENMEAGVGLRQLDIASDILFASGRFRYLLKRLVYVAEQPVTVLDGLPVLVPDDEYEELGVLWVPPHAVQIAAEELEVVLPENWLQPEAREGRLETPERAEWQKYAESEISEGNLADALRRALESDP